MIKSLLIDDEPIALRVLASHLERVPDVEVTATSTDAVEALAILKRQPIDLVFLDIEMPTLTGIGLVEAADDLPPFIFTTAHREYALDGFELDAVDYLLKPVSLPRLLRALEKFRRTREEARERAPASKSIHVRVDRRTVRVDLETVRFIEGLSDYVIIHTDAEKLTTKLRLSDLEADLAEDGFIRIHRSYLVQLARIGSFTASQVEIEGASLPVSRTYRRGVMAQLEKRSL